MSRERLDDVLVALALAACAATCLAFRYLPMVDLPQHYAMVSILLHHGDPAWGFAQRFTFDFVGRPYATVYGLGWLLGLVLPLGAAMRIVVALCTIAPLAGMAVLLRALGRPRFWVLAATPFAFGSLWHWGFLNFLLGTGLFLGGLALVVRLAAQSSRRTSIALGGLALALFFTHFHGLVMLCVTAPLLAWAWGDESAIRAAMVRALAPLVPAGVAGALFVALTWSQAEGSWAQMSPPLGERIARFPEFLAGGLPAPWVDGTVVAFAIAVGLAVALGGGDGAAARPRRQTLACAAALGGQVLLYLVLPLNTNTATYVSARHALLIALFVLPLLPAVQGRMESLVRGALVVVAVGGVAIAARQNACFDREAREIDPILAAMKPAQRVAPLIWARGSACCDARAFPYLHFAAYYTAASGGDLARTFAVVWNVPIRYRADYDRYVMREDFEWNPFAFTAADARHFDALLVRGDVDPSARLGAREVTRSGAFRLLEVLDPLPAALPPP